jgi:hypothetical protein
LLRTLLDRFYVVHHCRTRLIDYFKLAARLLGKEALFTNAFFYLLLDAENLLVELANALFDSI